MYGWAFLQLEMLKYGIAEVFFHRKCLNKVRTVCYLVKKAKLKYAWCCLPLKMLTFEISGGFFYWKCWNKVLMGFWPIKNAKTRYGWSFILLEMLKKGTAKARLGSSIVQKANIRCAWGLMYLTCWTETQLGSYIVKNAKTRYS